MADLAQLESALVKADAAGDTDGARILASEIRSMRGASRTSLGDTIAGLPATRFAMGLASPIIAAAQGGMNLGSKISGALGGATTGPGSGEWMNQQIRNYEEAKQRGMQAAGKEGYDWMGLAGSLAPAGTLASEVGQLLPKATGLLGRIGVGATQGGAVAAATPTTDADYLAGKARQTGTGMAIGGTLPLAHKVGQIAGNVATPVIDLFRESGPANFLRRYHREIVGEQNIPKLLPALQRPKQLVPGSKPTAAEAVAGIPEGSPIQAAQKITARTPGGSSAKFGERFAQQAAAREKMLQRIAPGVTEEGATSARTAASKVNYDIANKEIVKADTQIKALLERPSMSKAIEVAKKLAKEEGIVFPTKRSHYSVKELHYVKLALDDMTKNPQLYALGKVEAGAIGKTKEALLGWLKEKSPAYEFARSEHARLSEPINRAQVRDFLQSKLMSPTGKETPGAYLRTLEDATKLLKTATGNPRYSNLGQVLQPQEAKAAHAVAADLERSLAARSPLQPTELPGGVNVSKEVMPHLPALLSRPVVITNWLLNKLGKANIEPRIDELAAQMYLRPQLLAQGLQQPPVNPQVQRMLGQLYALSLAGGASAGARP